MGWESGSARLELFYLVSLYLYPGHGAAVTSQDLGVQVPAHSHGSQDHQHCAAKAIFYCPTMNSHRPRSQNTAKEQALIPEKDSRRT
jgi:hypothetical protein